MTLFMCGKIIEGLVPNLSDPTTSGAGRLGTLKYYIFRWRSI